jgi:hypothetical protein
VQITLAAHLHVDQGMAGQLIQHMIKETNAGFIVICSGSIQIDVDLNIGFGRFPADRGAAHVIVLFALALL